MPHGVSFLVSRWSEHGILLVPSKGLIALKKKKSQTNSWHLEDFKGCLKLPPFRMKMMETNAFQPQILNSPTATKLVADMTNDLISCTCSHIYLQKGVKRQNTETDARPWKLFEINPVLRLWKCVFNAALSIYFSQATSRLLGLYLKALTSLMLSNLLNDSFFAYQRQTLPCMLAKPDLILNHVLILWSWYFQQCRTTNHSIFIMILQWCNFLRK